MRTGHAFSWLMAIILSMPAFIFAGTYSGRGCTAEVPYQISKAADWQELMNTSANWDKCFLLMNDLDLTVVPLIPLVSEIITLTFILDGKGNVFHNMVIKNPYR